MRSYYISYSTTIDSTDSERQLSWIKSSALGYLRASTLTIKFQFASFSRLSCISIGMRCSYEFSLLGYRDASWTPSGLKDLKRSDLPFLCMAERVFVSTMAHTHVVPSGSRPCPENVGQFREVRLPLAMSILSTCVRLLSGSCVVWSLEM